MATKWKFAAIWICSLDTRLPRSLRRYSYPSWGSLNLSPHIASMGWSPLGPLGASFGSIQDDLGQKGIQVPATHRFGCPDLMLFVRGSLSLQFLEFSFPQQVRQQRQSKAKTPGLQSSCKSTAKQSRLKKHFAAVENRFNQVLDFWLQYSLYTAIQFLSDHFGWRHTHVGAPTTHQNKLARFQAF